MHLTENQAPNDHLSTVNGLVPRFRQRTPTRRAARPRVDVDALRQRGAGNRRGRLQPLRFFPKDLPVPESLFGILTILAACAAILGLFWEMRAVLSPFILVVAAAVLLYPFRTEPRVRPLIVVTAVAFLLWLMHTAFQVFVPFIASFLLAYIVDPIVTMLQRRHFVKRWISALVAALFLVGLIIVIAVYVLPVLFTQLGTAIGAIDEVARGAVRWAREGGLANLTGIPPEKAAAIVDRYIAPRVAGLEAAAFERAGEMTDRLPATISSVLTTVSNFLMIPFLTFYLVKDYWRIRAALYSFIPQVYQVRSQRVLSDMHEVVGGYLRGDLITSVFQGLMIGVGLAIIGVPGALLLGVVTGVLALIPYIGGILAYLLALLAGLGTPEPGTATLWITLLFLAQSIVETTLIGPHVMGRHTDLHPIVVMISLLLFGYFMGVVGMLIAIPTVGMLVRWAQRWRDRRQAELEQRKVDEDVLRNPHHARRGEGPQQAPSVTAGPRAPLP